MKHVHRRVQILVLTCFIGGSAALAIPSTNVAQLTGTDLLQAAGYTGKGVGVAIIDTGYDYPEVALTAWHDASEWQSEPIDAVRSGSGKRVAFGHGTMAAGCVRATAPEADLIAIRHGNTQAGVGRALHWAVQNKDRYHIRVINLSVAGGHSALIHSGVEEALAADIVVVASMGNNGPDYDGGACPAHLPDVLTVGGATDSTTVWLSSSRGCENDGLNKPDLCAPADLITTWKRPGNHFDDYSHEIQSIRELDDSSLVRYFREHPGYLRRWNIPDETLQASDDAPARLRSYLPRWYWVDSNHLVGDGTSLSAPLVAGIVAALRQARPNATQEQIRSALKATASPMDPKFSHDDCGAGFVNAKAALDWLRIQTSASP